MIMVTRTRNEKAKRMGMLTKSVPEPMGETVSTNTISLLSLMKLKGVGRVKALQIVKSPMIETGSECCRDELLESMARANLDAVGSIELADAWRKSEDQLDRGRELGVRAFSYHDDGYPARLRKTPDPPAVLFVKGSAEGLHASRGLAVVGTRAPTSYGREVAQRSGRIAAEAGFVVVSGLAHGCDTHAHGGCLEGRGVGVVVLAHGLDKVYPAANRGLAERLLENGGCLTSEYPVGTRPVPPAFAERNRIQSGLSDGVLVIETDVRGGTMHTVRFARDQGRALACIDHKKRYRSEDKTRGNQTLIADGCAIPYGTATRSHGSLMAWGRWRSRNRTPSRTRIPARRRSRSLIEILINERQGAVLACSFANRYRERTGRHFRRDRALRISDPGVPGRARAVRTSSPPAGSGP